MNISRLASRWAMPLPSPHGAGWGLPTRLYVGADTEAAAKAWIQTTDDEVRNIPVFKWVIELQDWVFHLADQFGVGSEVRRLVYDTRAIGYGTTYASPVLYPVATGVTTAAGNTAAGAAAGSSALTIAGGVAALGAVAVVAGIADAIFGGDDNAAAQAQKSAQKQALHLRDRLTLLDFAAEQDESAALHVALSYVPWKDKQAELSAAAVAQKLAQFYRAADSSADPDQRSAFESIANLSRWEGALGEYEKLSWPEKDSINIFFGKSAPRLPTQLWGTQANPGPIPKEQAALTAILQKHIEPPSATLGTWAKIGATFSGGVLLGLIILEPALARSLLARAGSTLTRVPQTVRRLLPR